ncbi:MAG TPA: ABC transporter permease [Actinomycetaceae bacterium]|nr:ABC transporter permease [Actinomycetaceae bacterium]
MITAVELGILYAVMALGVYLTFRVLEFADLTVDGSFTTGAAVAAVGIVSGQPPWLVTIYALFAGMLAGTITGLLHTKGNIDGLLAGILTQLSLYSINLRIMGRANVPLLREETVFTPARSAGILGSWWGPVLLLPIALVVLVFVIWFLKTNLGLAMRATGDNPSMISSLGVSTDNQKILGLAMSNGFVGLSGAFVAQYQGFADVGMGIGMIVAGLASVIIGQALFGRLTIGRAATAVVVGALLYRLVIFLALRAGLNPNDMKLVSAVLVIIALVVPQWKVIERLSRRWKAWRGTDPAVAATAVKVFREDDPLAGVPTEGEVRRDNEPVNGAHIHEADDATDPLANTGAQDDWEGR